jgi:hypothetical protein
MKIIPEKVIGVLGEAFKMRPVDTYFSTTSLEYFPGNRWQQMSGAVRAMRASRLDIKPKSGFAIGNVGRIAAVAQTKHYTLRILHEPEQDNKAHVAVSPPSTRRHGIVRNAGRRCWVGSRSQYG